MSRMSKSVASFVAALAISAPAFANVNIAVNGGFESGGFAGWTQFPTGSGSQTIVSPGSASANAANLNNTTPGAANLIKNANIGVGLVQPNSPITVSFDAIGNFGPGGVAFAELFSELSGGGTSASVILSGGPLNGAANFGDFSTGNWRSFSFNAVTGPNVSGGVTVQFNAATGAFAGSTSQLYVDNLRVVVVPEPATVGTLVAGSLLALRRRR
jgi:hypothetical protein